MRTMLVLLVAAPALAQAAPGDAIYAKRDATTYLVDTAGKRAAATGVVAAVAASVDQTNFAAAHCWQTTPAQTAGLLLLSGSWTCEVRKLWPAITSVQKLDLVVAGRGSDVISTDGSESVGAGPVSPALINAFTAAVLGKSQATVAEFTCSRAAPPTCSDVDVAVAAPAVWNADLLAGAVVATIGKVP